MSINICTVNLNNKIGLEKTFISILNQTIKPSKWIIVDGISDDGSLEIIEKIREEYFYPLEIIIEKDNGTYDAMNKGLFLSEMDSHILFLNSGDILKNKDCLEKISPILNDKSSDIVYGHSEIFFPKSGKKIKRKANNKAYIKYSLPTIHQSIFYPTSIKENLKYRLNFPISADYDLTLRASKICNLHKVDQIISVFEYGGHSSQNKLELIYDMARSQREVLGMNFVLVLIYAAIRMTKMTILRVISILK